MRTLLCSLEGCQAKATARCLCKGIELLFCSEHLGNHLIDSQGKHDYEKLLDDPYLQTKYDVLRYIHTEMKNLDSLKSNLTEEVYSKIFNFKKSLDDYIGKIDANIFLFGQHLDEIMQALENSNDKTGLEYLKLPSSEAIAYFKDNNKDLIDSISCELIISEIYKSVGFVKLSDFQEILNKNKELEVELLDFKTNMSQFIKENDELRQVYEEIKTKELEQTKTMESYEITNNQLKNIYDELYKEKRELELRYNQLIENNKSEESQSLNLPPAMNKPGFLQANFLKQTAFDSKPIALSGNLQTSMCTICKGRFANNEIRAKECGCLLCGNCPFPDFEKMHGFYNRRCRVCNRKKVFLTGIWA